MLNTRNMSHFLERQIKESLMERFYCVTEASGTAASMDIMSGLNISIISQSCALTVTVRKKSSSSLLASCLRLGRMEWGSVVLAGRNGSRGVGKGKGASFITVNALNELQSNRTCKKIQPVCMG